MAHTANHSVPEQGKFRRALAAIWAPCNPRTTPASTVASVLSVIRAVSVPLVVSLGHLLSKLNLQTGAPVLTLPLANGQVYSGDVSDQFRPATPFTFIPAPNI